MKTPEEIKFRLEWLAHPCSEVTYNCDKCRYKDICDNTYSCDVSKEALSLIAQLEEATPRWISVKDRMPNPYQHVIVHVRHTEKWRENAAPSEQWNVVEEDCWLGDGWEVNADDDIHEITHWMPLPEPPKEV